MIGNCTRLTRGFASRDFRKSRRFHFIRQLSKLSMVFRHVSFLQESAHAPMHRTRGPRVSTVANLACPELHPCGMKNAVAWSASTYRVHARFFEIAQLPRYQNHV